MTITTRRAFGGVRGTHTIRAAILGTFAAAVCGALGSGAAWAGVGHGRFCSATAVSLFNACRAELREDHFQAQTVCINVSDAGERRDCFDEAKSAYEEGDKLCRKQFSARRHACGAIGEGCYDPDFDPDEFDEDFESFDGDSPRRPELVSIDGSFKTGRDGDKPGMILPASPAPGEVYREEFSLGNAENIAKVLSTTYSYGADPALDDRVPQALAELLCHGDCLVMRNASLLEPGVFARKYYAPGICLFLEINPHTGQVVQLVECHVDARCASLPLP